MIRIIIFVLLMVVALTAVAQFRNGLRGGWENVDISSDIFMSQAEYQSAENDEPGVNLVMRGGYIYVKTDHTINVKVLSVLGSTVSDTTIDAGTFRLLLQKRGIYIVKAGKSARRVKVS
ncbi:MAG: hypothetical protein OSJ34_05510 [Muribaculaceae bacterium]|jgi:hypothetical protein|nr:hypothetical protein [Muribaculaceae bacterium]